MGVPPAKLHEKLGAIGGPASLVGRTPWSAADAPVGLLAPRKMLMSLCRLRDEGVPRGPGGPLPSRFFAPVHKSAARPSLVGRAGSPLGPLPIRAHLGLPWWGGLQPANPSEARTFHPRHLPLPSLLQFHLHVPQGPDRQSRRDRRPRHP